MSDAIPEKFMTAAANLANQLLDRGLGDEIRYTEIIARALMAAAKEADEAATMRAVIAVDAQISEYQTEQRQRRIKCETTEAFAAGEAIIALASVKAAILKGEA